MTGGSAALFEAFLSQHDEAAWAKVLRTLTPFIDDVDRAATQIWFHFFPLSLAQVLERAKDPEELAFKLVLAGNFSLKDQIDSSHRFLYGHRYWAEVKKAVVEYAQSPQGPPTLDLSAQIRDVAKQVAEKVGVAESLIVGMTAVAFMTLQQVGLDAFQVLPGSASPGSGSDSRRPEQVLEARARNDRLRLFSYLKHFQRVWTVTFNESNERATFEVINSQLLTNGAANDKRPHHLRDPRCTPNEGPIPVQCRAGSCGTCWVGVLAGREKLSPVSAFERRRMKEFGYIDSDEPHPVIRLACQSEAYGAVSIVIPPWNGVFGRFMRKWKEEQAETPAGSSLEADAVG
jgi:ferredoxin